MSKMKYSGIDWIGIIPDKWKINRLRYNCKFKTGGTPSDKEGINSCNDGYPWITAQDMNDGLYINNFSLYINKEIVKEYRYKLFPRNSILLVCIASVGKIGYISKECYSNQQITAIMPNENVESKYLLYFIKSMTPMIVKDASSNVVSIINTQYLANIPCCIPYLQEQKLIANFLDEKINKIDAILNKLNNQTEILNNYKKSLITETVTRGLDKNKKLKNSNVNWIGMINENAEIIKLKYFSYMKGRIGWQGLQADDFIDEGPFCITGTDFIDGKVNWDTCYHVSEERYNMDSNIQVKNGDLLLTKDGTIGKLAIIENLQYKACLNSHLLIIRSLENKFTNKYLYYIMASHIFSKYYKLVSSGSIMDSLSQEKVGNFAIPIYNLSVQEQMVEYLDKKCSTIDKIIENKKKQIEKMEQYKKSVIYEYVTGKKRVKGAEDLYE